MICRLELNNGLVIIGNYVDETDKRITLRIHGSSPYPQVRSYMKEDVKSALLEKGIRGLYKKALEL